MKYSKINPWYIAIKIIYLAYFPGIIALVDTLIYRYLLSKNLSLTQLVLALLASTVVIFLILELVRGIFLYILTKEWVAFRWKLPKLF